MRVPITRRSLSLMYRLRAQVGAETDTVVRNVAGAWVESWDRLRTSWADAIGDVLDVVARSPGPVPTYLLDRVDRLALALAQTQTSLQALAASAASTTAAGATNIIAITAAAEPAVIAAQLPAAIAASAVTRYAARVVPSALEAIALRVREQVNARHWPLARDATEAMRRNLVTAVAAGDHPSTAARRMLADTETHFNGGLARAQNIARTEMLDAYRDTAQHVHTANEDVLDCWVWLADLSPRTCPSCWGMHGTEHPLSQPGPHDHQQGRCARMPKVKTWASLGLALEEDDDLFPDAGAAYKALSPADQVAAMGSRRAALLAEGHITLADLAQRRDTAEWRPSYVPRTLQSLDTIARRRRAAAARAARG